MERVGIRELRQNLSVYLKKVKQGTAFEVTDRGEPVAILKPTSQGDSFEAKWQRLIDEGVVRPAKNPVWDVKAPEGPIDHENTTSKYLQEMREDRI